MRKLIFAVVLVLIGICPMAAQAAEGRESFWGAGGMAWPEGTDATWYVTGGFRYHLDDNWAIEPDFGYWKQDEAQELRLNRGTVVFSLSDFHVGGNLMLVGSWGDVGLYAGGGAAAHWRKSQIEQNVNPPHDSPEIDETRLGLQVIFGADFPITTNMDITAAIRDDFIFRGEDETGLDLDTQVVFKAYAGLRFYIN